MTQQNTMDECAAEILDLIEDLETAHAAAVRADVTFWNTPRSGTFAQQNALAREVQDRRYRLEAELEAAQAALEAHLDRIAD